MGGVNLCLEEEVNDSLYGNLREFQGNGLHFKRSPREFGDILKDISGNFKGIQGFPTGNREDF